MKKKFPIILLDQAVVSASNFILMILFARYLGPLEFGKYGLILFYAYLINMIVQSTVNTTLSINLHKFSINKVNYHIYSIGKYLIILIILLGLFILLVEFKVYDRHIIYESMMFLSAYSMYDLFRKYYFITFKYLTLLIFDILYFSSLYLFIFYISCEVTINNIFISYFIPTISIIILSIIINFISMRTNMPIIFSIPKIKFFILSEIKTVKILFLSAMLQWFNSRIIFYMLAFLHSTKYVGILQGYLSIIGIFNPLMIALDNYLLPKVSAEYSKHNNILKVQKKIKKLLIIMQIFFFITMLVIFVFSKEIVTLTLGIEYVEYTNILVFLFIINYMTLIVKEKTILLYLLKKENVILTNTIFIFITIIVISYPIIESLNIYGSVILLTSIATLNYILLSYYIKVFLKNENNTY